MWSTASKPGHCAGRNVRLIYETGSPLDVFYIPIYRRVVFFFLSIFVSFPTIKWCVLFLTCLSHNRQIKPDWSAILFSFVATKAVTPQLAVRSWLLSPEERPLHKVGDLHPYLNRKRERYQLRRLWRIFWLCVLKNKLNFLNVFLIMRRSSSDANLTVRFPQHKSIVL